MTAAQAPDHDLPTLIAGEKETLLAFLDYLRVSVDRKLEGLSEDDARRRLVPSGTTLLGLVKHLTLVEAYWAQRRFAGSDVVLRGDGFELDPIDTVTSARHAYAEARQRTDAIVAACTDLDRPLARGRHGLTLRWMLAHLVEETGRHAGHADILRELVDGQTGR
jgi:uncharacterized damage-inducible protein DinB